jgi:glutaredoxin 3
VQSAGAKFAEVAIFCPMPSVVVVLYTTTYCGHCRSAKHLLNTKGIAYREVDVTQDPGARRWLARTTGLTTVPQIFIDDKPVGGYAELGALDRSGKLARIVAGEEPAEAVKARVQHG